MNKEVIRRTVIKLNINTQTRINSFTLTANGHRKGNNHGDLLYTVQAKDEVSMVVRIPRTEQCLHAARQYQVFVVFVTPSLQI
jgi:hypothetical protein